MQKIALCILIFSVCLFAKIEAEEASYSQKVVSFLETHPNISRATIIALTTLETLAINSKIEFLGIAPANKSYTSSEYVAHNTANAFPTVAHYLKIDTEKYNAGPMVKATNIPALTALAGIEGQNYGLTQALHKPNHPILESQLLTLGGYLCAWVILLSFGALRCK